MPINIIAAVGKNCFENPPYVIGYKNQMPWGRLPRDLKRFRDLTIGHTIVMGRKTWDSLPEKYRPLPNRRNIIMTRDRYFRAQGAIICSNFRAIIECSKSEQIFIIGGGDIYYQFLPHASQIFLTKIDALFQGDTFFPEIPNILWEKTESVAHLPDEKNQYQITFERYMFK